MIRTSHKVIISVYSRFFIFEKIESREESGVFIRGLCQTEGARLSNRHFRPFFAAIKVPKPSFKMSEGHH